MDDTDVGDYLPLRVVTNKNWLAKQFEPLGAVQDHGFDIDPQVAARILWWAPGAWVASARNAGVGLPLLSAGPYWLERLPMDYRKRVVKTMTVEESIRRAPAEGEWEVFVKLPEAKHDGFPARRHLRNRHWATTIGQYHLPPGTLIQLQDIRGFRTEKRYWIAHGEIVAESLYAHDGRVWGEPEFDPETVPTRHLANMDQMMRDMLDDDRVEIPPGVVIDIGTDADGDPSVIEANAAWSSGPYDGDPAGILKAIRAAHDFTGAYLRWHHEPSKIFAAARPLKLITGELCWKTAKPKDQCGCADACPNCGRVGHDPSTVKCYLC